ncbi:MAG: class I SAM-dependent methyltransferase [Deltaproteobacteria bacterium]|nr:class I SAM-dependent methyltransferase [Deltaproteobacteria bacterium]
MSAATATHELVDRAMRDAAARYGADSRSVQGYVRGKLAWDPVYRQLAARAPFPEPVFDLGCGNGLLLVLLATVQPGLRAIGVDWDDARVRQATSATRTLDSIRIERGDVRDLEIPLSGTIFLVDVLHYLEPGDQDRVLQRAAAALSAEGRLYVRDVDRTTGLRSLINRSQEVIGRALGLHKGTGLHFRATGELVGVLSQLGLETSIVPSWGKLPLSNRLIEAWKKGHAAAD